MAKKAVPETSPFLRKEQQQLTTPELSYGFAGDGAGCELGAVGVLP